MKVYSLILVFLTLCLFSANAQNMTNKKMDAIIRKEAQKVEGQLGGWEFIYGNRPVMIITDDNANRMRIMTPIIEEKDMPEGRMKTLLEANFDRALDAKYSLFKNVLWSTYTHPLKELTKDQLIDAMQQVVRLADTYGSTYTSTDMIFGGEGG
ncbi:MAG: hypothetical protein ACPGJS_19820 [Flammeovirgaceae bacterium]